MIAYVTFLLLLLILIYPVSLVIALIVQLCKVPKKAKEMYPGVDKLIFMYENQNNSQNEEKYDD